MVKKRFSQDGAEYLVGKLPEFFRSLGFEEQEMKQRGEQYYDYDYPAHRTIVNPVFDPDRDGERPKLELSLGRTMIDVGEEQCRRKLLEALSGLGVEDDDRRRIIGMADSYSKNGLEFSTTLVIPPMMPKPRESDYEGWENVSARSEDIRSLYEHIQEKRLDASTSDPCPFCPESLVGLVTSSIILRIPSVFNRPNRDCKREGFIFNKSDADKYLEQIRVEVDPLVEAIEGLRSKAID